MPDTSPATAPATNQLPPRTTTSTRWPRKWATLGGRSTPASAMITTTQIDDPDSTTTFESNGSSKKTSNGSHSHANGHHHHHSSLFRKSSTLSRTNNNPTTTIDGIETPSLKKSRSLMNVLRAKLNSPAVLRRFRTKSRESIKQTVTEISTNEHPIDEANVQTSLEITKKKSSSLPKSVRPPVVSSENQDEQPIAARKSRKRDPSPMRRFAHRLAQLTKSSSTSNEVHENGVDQKKHPRRSMSPSKSATLDSRSSPSPIPIHNKDEVDHINACYDEIRAKYFDTNTKRNPSATIDLLSHHPCAPPSTLSPTQRLQDILSTTTASSSIDYYDRPIIIDDGNIVDRSLSTISMNGSLRSNDYMNNYSQRLTSPLPDDPLLIARKQSNIKLNCMLSGYGFTTPFGQSNLHSGQHELFKFHHYYDVGKRRFDLNLTTNHQNRMFASMRTRPISRSIDSFRPTIPTTENESEPIVLPSDELIIREDGDPPSEQQQQQYASKIHVTPAVPVKVTTFVASSSTLPSEEQDEEFERNFLRAVDRALGVVVNKDQDSLYDVPLKIEENKMNLIEITERALSSFNNSEFLIDDQPKENEHMEKSINGTESPSVELFDRTGEMFDNETINWQSSAVYENGVVNREMPVDNEEVWSVVDELTRKTQELLYDEPKVSSRDD